MRGRTKLVLGFCGFALAIAAIAIVSTPRVIAQARAALVRDIDHPANYPFAWEAIVTVSPTNPVPGGAFTVPTTTSDGKLVQRLVIEHVSAYCTDLEIPAAALRVFGPVRTPGIGSTPQYEHYLPFGPSPTPSKQSVGEQTRLYTNPGSVVGLNIVEFEDFGTCALSMAGHFVTQ
jgi:hypothetical protein